MITDQTARLSKLAFEGPMGAKVAGSVFLAFFLVLFPVAVQLSSFRCATYKHRETCGLKGSSVKFPCSYPKHVHITSILGWSKNMHPNMKLLKEMPAYTFRMNYHERGNNDCTMELTDLKKSDASIYYFIYNYRNVKGHPMTCKGALGVRLHIFASPVSIMVEKLVRGQDVPVADWTVIEGQRIMLTCVPTCAANLNSNPGYIWYKNRLQLNGSRANSPSLSLDSISNEDTGSYVCAMIGYKDLPSSAVYLRVQGPPRNTVVSDSGSKKDRPPTLTHGGDAQTSTDQISNNFQTPKDKSMFTFSIMLATCVCFGWAITIMVAILVHNEKKEKKRRRCASSVPEPPDPYMALEINSMSAEYDTLDTERHSSAVDTVYENIHQPRNSMR